jgi:hypothetical protein
VGFVAEDAAVELFYAITSLSPDSIIPTALHTHPFINVTDALWRLTVSLNSTLKTIPQFVSVLSQINPTHSLPSNVSEIHFTILPSTPASCMWSLSFGFPHQTSVALLSSSVRVTFSADLILRDSIIGIFGDQYKS